MDLPTADSPHVNELDTVPEVEEEEVESSPLASPRHRGYNRVSRNSIADLRRSAVKRRRCFLTEEEDGEDSDDSLRDPDFAQDQNLENEESDGEPSPTPQPPPKKRAAISSKNPPVTSTTPLPSTRRMTMPTPSAILTPCQQFVLLLQHPVPLQKGVFFYKEHEAVQELQRSLDWRGKRSMRPILEMTNLKEESYNKIYHKIGTAWANALKN